VLQKLERHTEQWQIIQDSNNISEIKKFAHNLAETGVLYDFKPVIDYAQQLNERISIFDTQGIRQQLEKFSSLQAELLALIKPVQISHDEITANVEQ
jgi:hypothetical protein